MTYTDIAPLVRLPVDRGVAAIVGGEYVAVFRLAGGEVLAIDHVDPFTGMPVLARGIVGSVGERLVVASPLHKQRFDLRTGVCIDDPAMSVRAWRATVIDGVVRVDSEPIVDSATATHLGTFVNREAFEATVDAVDMGAA